MLSLRELQRAFAAELLDPRTAASPGMHVYRANVWGNWAQALTGAYPIVRKIVGEEFFEGLAHEYARAQPSASGDLNEYGAELAAFVGRFPHTQDLPYLPDVARMEWLAHRAHYAADTPPFDFKNISDPERWHPQLAPACALLTSKWPLARLWAVHQDGYKGEATVDLSAGPDRILVHRPHWRVQVSALAAGDYRFLRSAMEGASLGAALEAAVAEDPGFEPSAALACWVQAGVITL